MNFEWDENKAAINLSKHRVSFEEAKTVFDDPLYVDFYDPDHCDDEERSALLVPMAIAILDNAEMRSLHLA